MPIKPQREKQKNANATINNTPTIKSASNPIERINKIHPIRVYTHYHHPLRVSTITYHTSASSPNPPLEIKPPPIHSIPHPSAPIRRIVMHVEHWHIPLHLHPHSRDLLDMATAVDKDSRHFHAGWCSSHSSTSTTTSSSMSRHNSNGSSANP